MHKQIIFLFARSQLCFYVELFSGIITLLIVIKSVRFNISLFLLSFLPSFISFDPCIPIHCTWKVIVAIFHTHSVGLLWTRDRPPSQKPLPDNTQYPQETDTHSPGGIRTRNPSTRAAADTSLRPRRHRYRLFNIFGSWTLNLMKEWYFYIFPRLIPRTLSMS